MIIAICQLRMSYSLAFVQLRLSLLCDVGEHTVCQWRKSNINSKFSLRFQLLFSFPGFLLLPQLVVHRLILIIKVSGEPCRRNILNFIFKDLRDREAFLFQYEQEKHQLVFPLLPIVQFFLHFFSQMLQFIVFLDHLLDLVNHLSIVSFQSSTSSLIFHTLFEYFLGSSFLIRKINL